MGLRPIHLKNLLGCDTSVACETLKEAITAFVDTLMHGEIPNLTYAYFFGTSLCAPSKKDGGIQTIAVGNNLRCLAKVGHEANHKTWDTISGLSNQAPAFISSHNTTAHLTMLILPQSFDNLAEIVSFWKEYSRVKLIPTQKSKQMTWDFISPKASLKH